MLFGEGITVVAATALVIGQTRIGRSVEHEVFPTEFGVEFFGYRNGFGRSLHRLFPFLGIISRVHQRRAVVIVESDIVGVAVDQRRGGIE